jgi:hypothetical protein
MSATVPTITEFDALVARVAKLEAAVPPVVVPGPYPLSLQAAIDSAAPGAVIDVTGGPVYRELLVIKRPLTLIGAKVDASVGVGDTVYGVHLDNAHDVTLRSCDFGKASYCGVMGISSWNIRIEACTVHDIVNKRPDFNAYGIAASDYGSNRSHDWAIVGNTIDNIPNWHGIDTHGGQRITIEDNVIHRTNRAIFITSGYIDADLVTLNRNTMDLPTKRPDVANTYPYNMRGITIIDGSTNVKGDSNAYDGWPNGGHRSGPGTFTNDKVTNPK